MTNYRNYRIRTISIPERDEEGEPTGNDIILEVVSMETLMTTVQTFEGGSITEEKLYFVCFRKQEGEPRGLHVISAETDGEIKILRYEHESNELRGGDKTTGRRERKNDSRDNNP